MESGWQHERGSESSQPQTVPSYRGRLAPSPTGRLHMGHCATFWVAAQRASMARQAGHESRLVMRIDDLDGDRSKPEFVAAAVEDLSWLGIHWDEGPDVGGAHQPYVQSQRMEHYRAALEVLQAKGLVYKCYCSRKDIAAALSAPHMGEEEPPYPGTCRPLQQANLQEPQQQATVSQTGQFAPHQHLQHCNPSCHELPSSASSAQQHDAGSSHTSQSSDTEIASQAGNTQQPGEQHVQSGSMSHASSSADLHLSCCSAPPPPAAAAPAVSSQPEKVVPSSVARQQLKAARRAEREAKQAQARQARLSEHRQAPGNAQHARAGPLARSKSSSSVTQGSSQRWTWRFRVPDGEVIQFFDNRLGVQAFTAGKDFGDFIVWRQDGLPAYQLACVVDDASMGITEVVRGQDLLMSTARQLLLYRALGLPSPSFYHCPLVVDPATGQRLAKRHDALSLKALRDAGVSPQQVLSQVGQQSSSNTHVPDAQGSGQEVSQ